MLRRSKNYSWFFFLSTGLCVQRRLHATRPAQASAHLPVRQSTAEIWQILLYRHLYVFNAKLKNSATRGRRPAENRHKASKYAAFGPIGHDARRTRRSATQLPRYVRAEIARVDKDTSHAACDRQKVVPGSLGRDQKKNLAYPETTHSNASIAQNCATFADAQTSRAQPMSMRAMQVSGNFRCVRAMKIDAIDRQCSSLSISSAYASGSSSSSVSSARLLGLTTKIQPSPNASSLIVSGLSARALLTDITLPETGA